MDLKRKLSRLSSAGPGSRHDAPGPAVGATALAALDEHALAAQVPAPLVEPSPPARDGAAREDPVRAARIAELRGRIRAMMARPARDADALPAAPRVPLDEALAVAREQTEHGVVHARARTYEVTARHGAVPLHTALEARGDAVATLALDPALAAFDPARALYLDTETTGLAGGTGTIPFLVGVGAFDGRRMRVEQYFLAELCDEPALLARLAARIEAASALVTYNGKAFDLPLLRSRFVLARIAAPREPPHLDLVHVARRIYGRRVAQCKLTTLERDVLGFVREDDVPSGEIPARYVHYLRTGDAAPLAGVIEHNLWDVTAMAALVGELAARAGGGDASGRFEPADMAQLARTALRAGARELASALADDAAALSAARGLPVLAANASTLAARIHRRRGDHHATHRALLEALAHTPDDPEIHLLLAKLYEHKLRDPARALEHTLAARAAEAPAEHARRVARLRRRARQEQLRLPGME